MKHRILAATAGLIVILTLACSLTGGSTDGERSSAPTETAVPAAGTMELDTDRPGHNYKDFDLSDADPELCQRACDEDPKCKAWTYVKPNTTQGSQPRCWLKHTVPGPRGDECCVSGVKGE